MTRTLILRPALLTLALATLAAAPRADFITGQVVDQLGVGVPGVDIDVKNLGSGGDPAIFNDGTDANGFFTTTLPAGLYRVTFNPPPPPTTTHLIREVEDVIVVGTTNMGVVGLPAGVALSGRALDSLSLPVAGVNIDVIDEATGDNLPLVGGTTDVFGRFAVAVPANSVELRLNASPVIAQTLASVAQAHTLVSDLDVGDVTFPPGFRISGSVSGPGAIPVEGLDFDALDASGNELYTPQDNTDAGGAFSFVVPAGTYDLVLCPPFADRLVARTLSAVAVQGDVVLGSVALDPGVVLAGTIRAHDGALVPGSDVDVSRSDGTPVTLCGDNANGAGAYAVVVPTGTLSVEFEPPGFALPLGAQDVAGVPVAGDTILDASLPACDFGTSLGRGVPGAGGIVPTLVTSGGAPRPGNPGFGFEIASGLGKAMATLFLAADPTVGRSGRARVVPAGSVMTAGRLPVFAPMVLGGVNGVAGTGTASVSMTIDASMIGVTVFGRAVVFDLGAPGGLAQSRVLQVSFCD